jgi:hypothetical protein
MNFSIKNEEGQSIQDICVSNEILEFLKERCPINSNRMRSPTDSDSQNVSRPAIIIGWIYKTGPLIFNIKRRFFVLDPYDGTFIRYKEKEDYPLKPR